MNKVILMGRLGKDPELRVLVSGGNICSFTLATSKKYIDKSGNKQEKTEWHNCQCWNKLAETASKYLKKGSQVLIEGEINYESYEKNGEKKYITKINCTGLDFVGAKQESQQQSNQQQDYPPPMEDDLPF